MTTRKPQLQTVLDNETIEQFKEAAARQGLSASSLSRKMILEFLMEDSIKRGGHL